LDRWNNADVLEVVSKEEIIRKEDNNQLPRQITWNSIIKSPNWTNATRSQRKKKKFYVLHIGPSKTGTSTIQKDSSKHPRMQKALEKDHVVYQGNFADKGNHRPFNLANQCMDRIINNATLNTTKELLLDCWSKKELGIDRFDLIKKNIVYSYESLSYKKDRPKIQIQRIHEIYMKYLDYDELIVVGTYRRYAEWIASAYKETTRQFCLEAPYWPTSTTNRRSYCEPIWKHMMDHVHSIHYSSTRKEYHNIDETLGNLTNLPSGVSVRILTYFVRPNNEYYNSITSELYCEVLGQERTPETCRVSKGLGNETDTNIRTGSVDMIAYDHILVAATAAGGNRDWINTSDTKRIAARNELADYHEALLANTNSTKTSIMMRLPLVCPPLYELEELLNKSLAFEQKIMDSDFYLSPIGKDAHTQQFWEMVNEKKLFCRVDTDRLFETVSSFEQALEQRLNIDEWGSAKISG